MAKSQNNTKYPSIDDLSDSMLMMTSKPRKTALYLIYIIFGIVVVFFIWAAFAHKDDYVKVPGEIRPINEDAIISSPVNGTITQLNVQNDDIVKKGQLLMKLDTSALQKQEKLMKDEIHKSNDKLKNYELLKTSIRENKNEFSKNGDTSDFHDMYEKYKSDLRNAKQQADNSDVSLDQNKQNAKDTINVNTDKLNSINQQLTLYSIYKTSVNDNQDKFHDEQKNSSIYAAYKVYKDNYDTLQEKMQENPNENDDIQTQLHTLKLKEEATIDSSVDTLNTTLKAAQYAIDNSQKSLTLFTQISSDRSIAEQNVTLTTLNQITASMTSLHQNLLDYQLKLVDIKNGIDNSNIRANKAGKVMMQSTLKVGTNIPAGNELMKIVSTNNRLNFELTVPNRYISSFKIGKSVKFEINSLPYADYGDAKGKIIEVSPDAIIDQKTNQNYYLVECSLDDAQLKKKDGKTANLLTGMQGEGIVIDKSRTVLSWILKELNMWLHA